MSTEKNWGKKINRPEGRKSNDIDDIIITFEELLDFNIDKTDDIVYLFIVTTNKYKYINSPRTEILRLNKNITIKENIEKFNKEVKNIKYLVIRDERYYNNFKNYYYLID